MWLWIIQFKSLVPLYIFILKLLLELFWVKKSKSDRMTQFDRCFKVKKGKVCKLPIYHWFYTNQQQFHLLSPMISLNLPTKSTPI